MKVSLNEIEQTVLKAARGAGVSWGEAEDVASAARWLASNRISWLQSLVNALDARGQKLGTPRSGVFMAGVLSDETALQSGVTLTVERDGLWVLAHAAGQAIACRRCITIRTSKGNVSIAPSGSIAAADSEWQNGVSGTMTLAFDEAPAPTPAAEIAVSGHDVDIGWWRRLEDFAVATYVPASEYSRRTGAGAGTIDND
jgi:hypothetical protein